MVNIVLLVLIIANVIVNNEAARILAVFPIPSISHQIVFRPLTQELAKRGHEVTVITPDPAFSKGNAPENLTEIDVHDISYEIWKKYFVATATGKKSDLYTQIKVVFDVTTMIFEKQVQSDEVQKLMKEKNSYDLLLIEAFVRPAMVFSFVFNVPVIKVSSFGAIFDNYDVIGAPTHVLLYPSILRQRLYNLTWWEKITEAYEHFSLQYLIHNHQTVENQMLRRNFGPNIPSVNELNNNVDMLFLNTYPIWEGNHPVPPSVIHIGGLHQKPVKELPKDLKNYIDSSKYGVIYMSFGTNTDTSALAPEKVQIFINAFSKLPYNVLWKWDKGELPQRSGNIKISNWFPQSDLLRHPKIKLFITQGGLQSIDESITAGVPLIGIPMLGDQWYNTEKFTYHKIGLKLDLETLTEEIFKNAIETVIKDDSYRANVARLRTLMADQPQRPLERAVWWTEHVLRHAGARHLRAPAANITWAQYLELNLIGSVLLGLLLSMTTIVYIFLSTNKFIRRKLKQKKN